MAAVGGRLVARLGSSGISEPDAEERLGLTVGVAGWSKMAATCHTGARIRAVAVTLCTNGDGHPLLWGCGLTAWGVLVVAVAWGGHRGVRYAGN